MHPAVKYTTKKKEEEQEERRKTDSLVHFRWRHIWLDDCLDQRKNNARENEQLVQRKRKRKENTRQQKKVFFSIRVRWINCSPKTKTLFILFIIVPE